MSELAIAVVEAGGDCGGAGGAGRACAQAFKYGLLAI